LGRILGIPIQLDLSWFLVFALITWTLAVGYFPATFKNWPTAEYWIVGAVTAVFFFASVLVHELSHSMVARRYHIEVRGITLFIFGGVSQIAGNPPSAGAELLIAVAGPLTSFALAGVFALLGRAFTGVEPLLAPARYLATINVLLGAFNLIPGFPLDGGRVFRSILWGTTHDLRRATRIAGTVGQFIAFLFILFGVYQLFTGNIANGLWIAFIGWFLQSAAVSEVQQQRLHDLLAGHTVSQAMHTDCATAPAGLTLQELIDHHILEGGKRCLVLTTGDQVAGLLTLHHIRETPREQWPVLTAAQVMTPFSQVKKVEPNVELVEALQQMDRDGVNQLPVMADDRLVGMLSRDDVISYLRTLQELGH
jgi:Zn-dependent protease